MARFLSHAWLAELEAAARASTEVREAAAHAELTIQQVVTGMAAGDVSYTVRLHHGEVEVRPGPAVAPHVTITQAEDVAAAIHRGDLGARTALDEGRLRVTGDVPTLVAHQGSLQRLASVFADVRTRTTYD